MRWILLWLLSLAWACACMPSTDRVNLWLNKPGLSWRRPPAEFLKRWEARVEGSRVLVGADKSGIPRITLRLRPIERPVAIGSSVDLRPWFEDRSCSLNWDLFHACMKERKNRHDEKLYRILDRRLVSKLLCEEGRRCIDPAFRLWSVHWNSPTSITLEAAIGPGGFATLEAARKSLHRINALLKKTLYGARFPEEYGEGRSKYEIYTVKRIRSPKRDFEVPLKRLLRALIKGGYLKGIREQEIDAIGAEARGGAIIYYRTAVCSEEGNPARESADSEASAGWRSLEASASVSFDARLCPRFAFMKCI